MSAVLLYYYHFAYYYAMFITLLDHVNKNYSVSPTFVACNLIYSQNLTSISFN